MAMTADHSIVRHPRSFIALRTDILIHPLKA